MINARSETSGTLPAFREALKLRRCLVPADGFYEWRRSATGKQPYCFDVNDGEMFVFAGLWDRWRSARRAVDQVALDPNHHTQYCDISS